MKRVTLPGADNILDNPSRWTTSESLTPFASHVVRECCPSLNWRASGTGFFKKVS